MKSTIINFKKMRNEKVEIFPHIGGFRLRDTRTYKITENDPESIKMMLDNASETDIFGYEMMLTKTGNKVTMFHTDEIATLDQTQQILLSTYPDDLKHMSLFYLALQKPSCFPLNMTSNILVLDSVLKSLRVSTEKVLLQILVQKQSDSWKRKVEDLYESYLTGIDHPANNKGILAIQQKVNELTNKVESWNFKHQEIESLQQKLGEDGFRVVIRLSVFGEKQTERERIANDILKCFRKIDQHNSWCLSPVLFRKANFIENIQLRRFPLLHGKYQYLCTSELISMLAFNDISLPKVEQDNPSQEVVYSDENKTVRISYKLPSLSHLPKGSSNTKEDDTKHEDAINKALERVGIVKDKKVNVIKVQQGATLKKVTFNLPQGVKYSQIENAKKDIQNELGLNNISIEQGEKAGTVALGIPKEKRDTVFLRDHIDTAEFRDYARTHELPFFIGVDTTGKPIYEDLARIKHILEAGATGSGKSVWLNQFILTLLLTKTPKELCLYLIDPKMVELTQFRGFPHVKDVIIEPDKSLVLLKKLVVEMNERYKKFAHAGCRNIQQYNRKSSEIMQYIVVVIDEFADLFMTEQDIEVECIKLAQKARACGIHLVLATQRPSVDVIKGLLKAQFPSRIVFACSSTSDYRTVLDQKPPFKLLGRGDGVCQLEGVDSLQRFQGALISTSEEQDLEVIQKIKDEWNAILDGKEIPLELPEPEQPLPEPTLLERAKFFICEERDTRVRSMQQHLKVSSQEIKRIYTELVSDGWLEEPTNPRSGYKILLDENSLDEFAKMFVTQYCYSKAED